MIVEVSGYPGATRDEVANLENLWRESARLAKIVSLTLALGKRLPADVIGVIVEHTHPNFREHVVDATRVGHALYRTVSEPR